MQSNEHWRRTLLLTALVLVLWGGVGFGAVYFARELTQPFFGWPLLFWIAAFGGPLAFVLMVWLYARTMKRWDEQSWRTDRV